MRTAQENLNDLGQMVNARADKPNMRSQNALINSKPASGNLDKICEDMLLALGSAGDLEGKDGEGI